jgi:hypothetical protein
MSAKQAHFTTTNPKQLESVAALCKANIKDPVMMQVWDSLPVGTALDLSSINTVSTCSKCVLKLKESTEERLTFYAVKAEAALKGNPDQE